MPGEDRARADRAHRLLLAGATVALVGVLLGSNAPVAHADGAHGGNASDYRVEIVDIDGDAEGFEIEVIELGDRLRLERAGAHEVVILGYSGEPYLRVDADGVHQNERSPAVYLNRDRFATTPLPADADAAAPPRWTTIGEGDEVRWHDHRAHWMAAIPPLEAQQDPGREHLATRDVIPLVVDGAPVSVEITVTWVPPPSTAWWWIASALGAAAVAGAGLALGRPARVAPVLLVGVAGYVVADAPTPARVAVAAALAAVAFAALVVRRAEIVAVSAAAIAGAGLMRRTVFDHPVLAGRVDERLMRVGLVITLAAGVGCAVAAVVSAFRVTQPAATADHREPDVDGVRL